MNATTFKLSFFTVLIAMSSISYAGGPWLLKKKSLFIQGQAVIPAYAYDQLLVGSFIKDVQGINREVFNADFSIYGEYGISDKLNLIAVLPYKLVSTGALTDSLYFDNLLDEGSLSGLGNVQVAVKYSLVDSKVKVAASLQTSLSTASFDLDKGLATGFDSNSLGLVAHVGRSDEKQYGFLEVGYHYYTNNFSDVITIRLEHGWKLGERMNVAGALDVRHALENGSYRNENLEQTGLYPNNQGWAAVSGKLNYELENKVGFNLAMPLIPIKFNYVGFNGTFAFGVYKKF